jgi:hypothetical protein
MRFPRGCRFLAPENIDEGYLEMKSWWWRSFGVLRNRRAASYAPLGFFQHNRIIKIRPEYLTPRFRKILKK